MKISKEVQAQARRLMRLCIGADGLMDEAIVRQVADKIAADKPRNYLALLTAFTELVRLERAAHTATITSAVPLTEAEQAAIEARLNARQTGLNYEWQVDSSLIAGLTVKVGDNVTDASVRTRIEQLTKTL
ncbi:MAG: ATP synthase F1 subunit delta [Akkermansia sp.]|nr:ATP synthase F1 subunit delta [Akkermansia sp.]